MFYAVFIVLTLLWIIAMVTAMRSTFGTDEAKGED